MTFLARFGWFGREALLKLDHHNTKMEWQSGMNSIVHDTHDYKRVEKAIRYIETNFKSQPTLDEIARSIHLSRFHFDRLFKRWAGISPIQFLQFVTLDYTKQKLKESRSILDTAYDAGLSGPSRLHDLFITFEALTPGEFKEEGRGLVITYGFSLCPFGECLLATTKRGICHLGFVDPATRQQATRHLLQSWPGAEFRESSREIVGVARRIFDIDRKKSTRPFNLLLKGTNFQTKVWRALLEIPEGWVTCYQDIADYIGHPRAFRAVASAIAVNPVAYLIPCHRVIAKSGKIHRYRWGSTRKKVMIGWEAAKAI
jgi:AraC family transcriptional regulator of adaptative response/methylated-DNA-[protein]-cysteine methyltransferase